MSGRYYKHVVMEGLSMIKLEFDPQKMVDSIHHVVISYILCLDLSILVFTKPYKICYLHQDTASCHFFLP
jgi:hypothetical protein